MKSANIILVLAGAQGVVSSIPALFGRDCTGNNCNRAVTGTADLPNKPPVASRRADCSSFMLATVTPATSTFTAYTTVTETITKRRNAKRADATALDARQVTISPSAFPTYASACKDAMGFSSACSCWGITRTTTTVATPVTTTTSTVTATVSVCPDGAADCGTGCYRLKTNHDNCGACGNACLATQTCEKGVCVQKTCASDADCQGSCVCFKGVNGSGYCAPSQRCSENDSCATNAECGPGGVCVKTNCAKPKCRTADALSTCVNRRLTKRLFNMEEDQLDHE